MKKTHLSQLIKVKAVNANFKDGGENEPEINRSFGKCFGTEDFKEGGTTFFKAFPGNKGSLSTKM
jgi:enoyl-CoA hydratase